MRFTAKKSILLIAAIYIFKIILALYSTADTHEAFRLGYLAGASGDLGSYTLAMENYIQEGSYYFDNGKEKVFAGRLPHYSIPYFLFRQFFDLTTTYDLVALFQLLVESIAIFCLAKLVFFLTKKKWTFWLLIFLMTISTMVTVHSTKILTEGLVSSLIVFFIAHLIYWHKERKMSDFWLASLFLGLISTMRLYLGVLYPILGFYFIYLSFKESSSFKIGFYQLCKRVLVFAIPLLILLTPWTIRNYNLLNKFVPLQINPYAGYDFSQSRFAMRRLISSFGGSYIFWDPNSAGAFFFSSPLSKDYVLPEFVLETIPMDTINLLRKRFKAEGFQKGTPQDSLLAIDILAYRNKLKKEHWLQTNVINRLKITRKFIINNGTWYLPFAWQKATIGQKILKLSQSVLYLGTLFLGFVGFFFIRDQIISFIIYMIPLLIIIVFPLFRENCYVGYWVVAYPIFVLSTVLLLSRFNFAKYLNTKLT